jgi:hypothetical protein
MPSPPSTRAGSEQYHRPIGFSRRRHLRQRQSGHALAGRALAAGARLELLTPGDRYSRRRQVRWSPIGNAHTGDRDRFAERGSASRRLLSARPEFLDNGRSSFLGQLRTTYRQPKYAVYATLRMTLAHVRGSRPADS